MEEIYVDGENFSAAGFLLRVLHSQYDPQGSLARELAPQRLRELPPAAVLYRVAQFLRYDFALQDFNP